METVLKVAETALPVIGVLWLLWLAFRGDEQPPERQKPKTLRYCPTCKKYRRAD